MALTIDTILDDPRWDSDPVGLFDALTAKHGQTLTDEVWKQACQEADRRSAAAEPVELFVVRLWDGFDGLWMDVSEPVPREQADAIWREKTLNGTKMTSFSDIDYYKVFPSGTVMHFSYETRISQRDGSF